VGGSVYGHDEERLRARERPGAGPNAARRGQFTQIARGEADAFLAWLDRPTRAIRRMKKLVGAKPFEQR
jgi:hypothetical protein